MGMNLTQLLELLIAVPLMMIFLAIVSVAILCLRVVVWFYERWKYYQEEGKYIEEYEREMQRYE